MNASFIHINIIAEDWRKLSDFYIRVFTCVPKPPQRDLSGEWLDELTSMKDARIRGMHLLLPGFKDAGPTIEIFQYDETKGNKNKAINAAGFAHIAFAVDDVEAYLALIIENGGSAVGKSVDAEIDGLGKINVVYAKDPEGNIIELQKISS